MFGRLDVLPVVESFLGEYPQVEVRMLLLDRIVSLVDEGLDLGIRIGQLPDSSLRAVLVGQVRRVVCATPQYIARHGMPATPRDLANHCVVACTAVTPIPDRWPFYGPSGVASVAVTPRLVVNTTAAAMDAALDGLGFACIMSYQAELHTAAGLLQTVLVEYEPPPAPIHIVHPEGRHLPAKVRLFIDYAAERLRRKLGPQVEICIDPPVNRRFFWVNTPIITASDAEGAGIDFAMDFSGREAFLKISGHLNVEAHCLALTKVYTFGPTFRAENSNTSRHLAEFWMIKPEIAFAGLSDNAALAHLRGAIERKDRRTSFSSTSGSRRGFGLVTAFARGTLDDVTGLANVRDAIPYPRTPGNARC